MHFSTTFTERVETVDELLLRTEPEVRRVAAGQFADARPAVCNEGNPMIVLVVEEELMVEKRLRIKEEVYIVQTRGEYRNPQQVTLRIEVLSEERPLAETV